ncbi:unnamed protein product [Paramecium sonneborni]|uniref:Uncharacterized protein n=1 Tax=Paramecium sonneborni TaxID=65129 RepID=A0A8S1K3Y4_9CILI|nr:unnamed protein product [Paramecium sonneborni]
MIDMKLQIQIKGFKIMLHLIKLIFQILNHHCTNRPWRVSSSSGFTIICIFYCCIIQRYQCFYSIDNNKYKCYKDISDQSWQYIIIQIGKSIQQIDLPIQKYNQLILKIVKQKVFRNLLQKFKIMINLKMENNFKYRILETTEILIKQDPVIR